MVGHGSDIGPTRLTYPAQNNSNASANKYHKIPQMVLNIIALGRQQLVLNCKFAA